MIDRQQILHEIFDAMRRANQLRTPESQLECAEPTVLYGPGGSLDSLGLVSLILDIEEGLNSQYGTQLVLADEHAVSQRRNPFRDVRSLADYILSRLEENSSCKTHPSS